jgi:hypothetical protein
MLQKVMNAAAAVALLGLAACGEFGFPTTTEAICGVSGFGCHDECAATPMPAKGSDPNALSYHLGPTSCPTRFVDDARRAARRACHDRGMSLASSEPQLAQQPPVEPLAGAQTATFRCQG